MTTLPTEIPFSALSAHLENHPNRPAVVRGGAKEWPAFRAGITELLKEFPRLNEAESVPLGRLGQVTPWLSVATPLPALRAPSLVETTLLTRFADGAVSALHRDYADNLHTVFHGEKSWVIAPKNTPFCVVQPGMPGGPLGPQNSIFRRFEELPQRLGRYATEVRLRAGDTLYVPRGTWHAVRSHAGTEDTYGATSLIYTFFRPRESRLRRALALPLLTRAHNVLRTRGRQAGQRK